MLAEFLSERRKNIVSRREGAIAPVVIFLTAIIWIISAGEDVHFFMWLWELIPASLRTHLPVVHPRVAMWALFTISVVWLVVLAFKQPSLRTMVLQLRNDLRKFLLEVGETEPPQPAFNVPDAVYNAERKTYENSIGKAYYGFQRRFAPRVQDIIYRLGERGITDMPLNMAMDESQRKMEARDTMKTIVTRLGKLLEKLGG